MKKTIKSILLHIPLLQRIIRYILQIKRKRMYEKYCEEYAVNNKLIVFSSFRGRTYSCNPKAIYEKIIEDERFQILSLSGF